MGRTKKRRLHAHHILFRAEGGEDALWNLITLCGSCHKALHAAERAAIREAKGAAHGVPSVPE
jgi:5-methylcytosine-specific restriction endonuclease McrA